MLSSMVKVPMLFLLTLLVTFPSLYVFNALVGSRLTIASVLRLLIAALSVMLAVLASFGTIVAFFSFTTESYAFMLLLNVIVFGICGMLGLVFLLQTLHRLSLTERDLSPPALPEEARADESAGAVPTMQVSEEPGALSRLEGHVLASKVKTIFRIWVIVFALVGAQMSWVLRPFVGNPDRQFTFFRERDGNFFQAVGNTIGKLMGLESERQGEPTTRPYEREMRR